MPLFHPKSAPLRQRLSVSPLLIFFGMLICLLLPSPLSVPTPPTAVFQHVNGINDLSSARRPAPIQQQPSDSQSSIVRDSVNISGVDGSQIDMKPCSHIVLFSAPRHGSTWFIDSVEQCSFTLANNGTFGSLNSQTEIWNGGQNGVVRDMSTEDAVHYVVHNMSLKLFPTPWKVHRQEAVSIIERAHERGIPIVMLTRQPESALKSLLVAKETRVWNRVANSSSDSVQLSVEEEELLDYQNVISKHFDSARQYLESHSIPYDSFDYDVVKSMPQIDLPNSRCFVRNCNY